MNQQRLETRRLLQGTEFTDKSTNVISAETHSSRCNVDQYIDQGLRKPTASFAQPAYTKAGRDKGLTPATLDSTIWGDQLLNCPTQSSAPRW